VASSPSLVHLVGGFHHNESTDVAHGGIRFHITLLALLIWVVLQTLVAVQSLPENVVAILYQWKNVSGVTAVALGTVLYANRLKFTREFAPWYVLCVYVLVNLIRQGTDLRDFPSVGLYFVWGWCMFVLVPSVFQQRWQIQRFLRWSIWITVMILVMGGLSAIITGLPLYSPIYVVGRGIRYTFAFTHPGYFGTQVGSVVLALPLLWTLGPGTSERKLIIVVELAGIVSVSLADSRTIILMIVVSILVMMALRRGQGRGFGIMAVAVIAIYIHGIVTRSGLIYESLDAFTSGRLSVWMRQSAIFMGGQVERILLGAGLIAMDATRIRTGYGLVAAPFSTYRLDSTYIEVFLQHGLLGLFLVTMSLGLFWVRMIKTRQALLHRGQHNTAMVLDAAISTYSGVLVAALLNSFLLSMGNSLNAILLVGISAILSWASGLLQAEAAMSRRQV